MYQQKGKREMDDPWPQWRNFLYGTTVYLGFGKLFAYPQDTPKYRKRNGKRTKKMSTFCKLNHSSKIKKGVRY